ADTLKPTALTIEDLRERHPGVDEESLRARLIAGRGREGLPVPSKLSKAKTSAPPIGPARVLHRTKNQPDIER
ncbi:hypothetical protein, partial [Arthrobacter sp. CAL618]|uniref:hypothetical protein n=1 Tax=Arthrobacter sp. CAL618 TaxID=1055770 RepID=UPI001ED9AB59